MTQRPALSVEIFLAATFFWRVFWRVTLFLFAMLAALFGTHSLFAPHHALTPLTKASFFLTANLLSLLFEVFVLHNPPVWQPVQLGDQRYTFRFSQPMTWLRAFLILWAIGWRTLLVYSATLYLIGVMLPPMGVPALWYADSALNLFSQIFAFWWVIFHPLPWARTVFLVSRDHHL